MASIRIRNKADSGGIPGLTKGELAVNLADGVLWVGGTTDTPIYLSGVQTFNGLTGAVTGVTVGGANVFTQLNTFEAGISASGATLGRLVVNNGISAAGGITFNSLSHFTQGLSGSGATLGTLVVNSGISASGATFGNVIIHNGISASGGITFFGAVSAQQGVSASGATLGRLVVNGGISASGGLTLGGGVWAPGGITAGSMSQIGSLTVSGTISGGGLDVSGAGTTLGTLTVNSGATVSGRLNVGGVLDVVSGVTLRSTLDVVGIARFAAGLSASGATLGTLVVNNGISASGGVTFHNNVWVGGLLTASNGLSASGGVTFANTVYVGQTLQANANIYFGGDLYKNGEIVQTIVAVDTVDDLPESPANGEIIFVRGPEGTDDGFYFYNGFSSVWVKLSPQYNPNDINGDGIVDNVDLSFLLAAWSQTMMSSVTGGVSGPKFEVGIADGLTSSFEVKVYGINTGKKASAFRITSDDAVPQIYMKAGNVEMDSDLTIYPVGDYTTIIKQTGIIDTGYIHVKGLTSGGKGSTYDGNLAVGGLLTLNSGLSAGCGVTFNCLTHFTQGLSASGATLGTLVVNGGATFNGPVYMGATLTANSNIRFNSGFGISGGFIDAGWY